MHLHDCLRKLSLFSEAEAAEIQREAQARGGTAEAALDVVRDRLEAAIKEREALVQEIRAKASPTGTPSPMDALVDIFGEKQAREDDLPSKDQRSQYERALPHLKAILESHIAKGKSLADAFKAMVVEFASKAGARAKEIIEQFRTALVRFGKEVQAGVVKIAGYKPQAREKLVEDKYQVTYQPLSRFDGVGTLIPANQVTAAQAALADLDAELKSRGYADVEAFLADKLGYTEAELQKAFSAEQVDALGLAITNIEAGNGFVIGDQTGVGKGRINAGIIRFAQRSGMVPVFITEKENLLADIVRDLKDIGYTKFSPLITSNNIIGKRAIKTELGPLMTAPAKVWSQVMNTVAETGQLPKGYEAVFSLYSQMQTQKGKDTPRRRAILSLAPNAVVMMDESHNAAGGAPKTRKKKGGPANRAEFARMVVKRAKAVFYSSATWAKRPDAMPLYAATDLSLVYPDPKAIEEAFTRGGVPLQQITSSMLTRAGQYLRRERSFDGVKFGARPVAVSREAADELSDVMSQIVAVQPFIDEAIENWTKDNTSTGTTNVDGGDTGQDVSSTNFTSLMHNIVNQALLAQKASFIADEVIRAAKEGNQKPVLAVSNTMGSFLEEYAESHGIQVGQPLDVSFGAIVARYLERLRNIVVTDRATGDKRRVRIDDKYFSAGGLAELRRVGDAIAAADFSDLVVSPIDALLQRLEKAGLRTGEITGRRLYLEYGGELPILRARPASEITPQGRNEVIGDFQSGKVDVVLLNAAGSTGISLHSDRARAKDQRQRNMFIIQPAPNIDTFMQMLGRVHRTGQVIVPEYSYIYADIPAENRTAAVMMGKLAKLNASTTSSRGSRVMDMNIPDFVNDYGDQIVEQILAENPDLAGRLGGGFTDEEGGMLPGSVTKFTGRLSLLPVAEQEEIYADFLPRYEALLNQLDELGENALEAKTLDVDAKLLKSEQLTAPVEGATSSPFGQASYVEQYDIKSLYRPPAKEKIIADMAKHVGLPASTAEQPDVQAVQAIRVAHAPIVAKAVQEASARIDASLQTQMATLAAAEKMEADGDRGAGKQVEKAKAAIEKLRNLKQSFTTLGRINPGGTVKVMREDGNTYGVIMGIVVPGERVRNHAAPSAWSIRVQTSGFRVDFPLSSVVIRGRTDLSFGAMAEQVGSTIIEFQNGAPMPNGRTAPIWEYLTAFEKGGREQRIFLTGNVVAAFRASRGRGQIVHFKTADGSVRPAVLMSRETTIETMVADTPVDFPPSIPRTVEYLRKFGDQAHALESPDGALMLWVEGGRLEVKVKQAMSSGGRYHQNDDLVGALMPSALTGRKGGWMGATVPLSKAEAVVNAIYTSVETTLQARRNQADARQFLGITDQGRKADEKQSREQPLTMTPAFIAAADNPESRAALRTELDRLGLNDVGLTFGAGSAGGFRLAGLTPIIRIALGKAISPQETLRHEAIHAMKEMGLFTPREWAVLSDQAKRTWIKKYNIAERYADLSADEQIEEAIADAFRDASPEGFVPRLVARARSLVRAVRNWMNGLGFRSPEQIFNEVLSGAVGSRPRRMDLRGAVEAQTEREALSPGEMRALSRFMQTKQPITGFAGRLANVWRNLQQITRAATYQRFIDGFHAIELLERGQYQKLLDATLSGYKRSLMTRNLQARVRYIFEHGPIRWNRTTSDFEAVRGGGKGLLAVFSRLDSADKLNAWMGWAAANRAERLAGQGRENNMTAADIAMFKDLHLRPEYSFFPEVMADWRSFNKSMLDLAEQAGLINAQQRAVWEHDDYVPFFRVFDDSASGPRSGGSIHGQRSGVKRLFGGQDQLNDLLENIIRSSVHMLDASVKNLAMQRVTAMGISAGAMKRERLDWRVASIPVREAVRRLSQAGINIGVVPAAQRDQMLSMFQMVAPTDKQVVSLMVDGKVHYYRVFDPLLLDALHAFDVKQLGWFVKMFGAATRVLRKTVTSTPDFMAANFVRDSIAAWAQSGEKLKPFYSSAIGAFKAFQSNNPSVSSMAMQGVGAGWYSRTPEDLAAFVRREVQGARVQRGSVQAMTVHGAQALWDAHQKVGEASEMANRIAVYDAVKKRGGSDAEAAYQALDVLNFWRSGSSATAQTLIQLYPFLNARVQGLDRMYRALRRDPVRGTPVVIAGLAASRGALLMAISLALWWWNKDDDRYKRLEEWDKDANYHIFIDKQVAGELGISDHFTLPRAFEVSAMYSTIPERIANAAYGGTNRDWSIFAQQMGRMWAENFHLGFIPTPGQSLKDNVIGSMPQLLKPIVEVAGNRSAYFNRDIVPQRLERRLAEDRAQPWTGPAARTAGRATGLAPVEVEHLVRGYLGTLGYYSLAVSDGIMRELGTFPPAPESRVANWPVVRRFMRDDTDRGTTFLTQFYDLSNRAAAVAASLNGARAEGDPDRVTALLKEYPAETAIVHQLRDTAKRLSGINSDLRAIHFDWNMSPAKKRQELDRLYAERARLEPELKSVLEEFDKTKEAAGR